MSEQLARGLSRAARGVAIASALACLAACGGAAPQPETAPATAVTETRPLDAPAGPAATQARSAATVAAPPVAPVEVTVHGMSRCPYFSKAILTLIPIVRELGPAVDFDLEYIGHDDGAGGPTSMYGPGEVAGDVLQLCARAQNPTEQWLDFVECQAANRETIPDGWQSCASRAGLDVDAVRRCAVSDAGRELVLRSFETSAQAGANGSPTFFFDGRRYEGDRTTLAFQRALCAAYRGGRPPLCEQLPARPPVGAHIVFDGRCPVALCDIEAAQREALNKVPDAAIDVQDYRSEIGRAMVQRLGLQLLPAIVIEGRLDPETVRSLRDYEALQGAFVKTVGRFDPRAGTIRPVPVVDVRVLVDARCAGRGCDNADRVEGYIERQLEGARFTRVDVMTPDGQALWRRVRPALEAGAQGQTGLPLVIFPESIRQPSEFFGRFERRLVASGDGLLFPVGSWDPDAEVCDNSVDDDGDRAVDCRDGDCAGELLCRPARARRIELFMMSQCPYASKLVGTMMPVLDHFGRQRTKIDLRVGWIGTIEADGTLSSMHGQAEVDEDLRQACAQRHYAKGYAFMDYLACRAADPRSPEWAQCVREPLKVDVLRTCAEGAEGRALLRASFEATKALKIAASPTWLLNGRYDVTPARETTKIFDEFCARNKVAECGQPIATPAPAAPSPSPAPAASYVDLILTAQP